VPTFPHVAKGVLGGLVGAHAPLYVWRVHAWLVGRVGRHVLPRERRVTSFREGVLQVNTAPREKQRREGGEFTREEGETERKEEPN